MKTSALAGELGPALQRLRRSRATWRPALRETRPFFRETTPIIRDQIRPFARDVQPTVRDLRGAAKDLARGDAAPDAQLRGAQQASSTCSPTTRPAPPSSFLFWSAWGAHAGATLFTLQDAHGPVRRGMVLVSCPGYNVARAGRASATRSSACSTRLLNLPPEQQVCPQNMPPDELPP